MSRSLVYSLLWSIAGDGRLKVRQELGEYIRGVSTVPLPPATAQQSVVDYEARICDVYNTVQLQCSSEPLSQLARFDTCHWWTSTGKCMHVKLLSYFSEVLKS